MSTPPTSPQCAQSATCQAERDQRILDFPPFRRQPYQQPPSPPHNTPAALLVSILFLAILNILLINYACIELSSCSNTSVSWITPQFN